MFKIFHMVRGVPRPVGYAEAAEVYRSHLWLMNPFLRMALRMSVWSKIGCRGGWHIPEILPANGYLANWRPLEPWMEIEFIDFLAAHVLCEALEPDLSILGFSGLPRHRGY